MKQELTRIERMYDSVAEEWAAQFSGEHEKKPKDQEILHRFAHRIGKRSPVWDFGCGPGDTSHYLKNLGVEISGLDLSKKMLDQARTMYPDITFRKGNMLKLPFGGNSIAGIVSFYAIVHFTKGQAGSAFREIFRVLEPGGIFLLTFHIGEETIHITEYLGKTVDIDFMFFTSDYISSCLKRTGFEKIEIFEREPYPEVEYQSRRAYVFAEKPADAK